MSYEFIEHTADTAFEVSAATIVELFGDAARALRSLLVESGAVRSRVGRKIEVSAADVELLLVRWLEEILFLFDRERFLIACLDEGEFQEEEREVWFTARVSGEVFDPARHLFGTEIKAVTYHGLEVREVNGGWRARVVLDL